MNVERFNSKWTPEPYSGCWLWQGAIDRAGYGRFGRNGSNDLAHRAAHEMYFDQPIPAGFDVHHTCEIKTCVNPEHLRLMPRKLHLHLHEDSIAHTNSLKTHCLKGHAYSDLNTGNQTQRGRVTGRYCRRCDLDRKKRVQSY